MTLPLVVIVILGVLLLAVLGGALVRIPADTRDVAWLAGGEAPADPQVAEVYRRYLVRHRAHRFFGGLGGVLFAIVYIVTWQDSPDVAAGGGPLGDFLFCGIGGVLIGALSAETYRLSTRGSARAVATLAPHPPLARPDLARQARAAAGLALLIGIAAPLAGRGWSSLAVALPGAVVVAVGELTRRAIDDRRRPVLSDAAATVDLRIRTFASASVARLELAAGVLAVSWALSAGLGDPTRLPPAAQAISVALGTPISLVALVVAVVQLRGASPRPPRSFVAQPQVSAAA